MPQIVDKQGRPIQLASYQKNELYRKAKDAREKLRDVMCTRSETKNATDANVNKMIHSEFKHKGLVQTYKQAMQAIGADPKDCDPERLRRR